MAQDTIEIKPHYGIHIRPAGLVAQRASEFDEAITIHASGGASANAKSILEISALGACSGQILTVTSENQDAVEAIIQELHRSCLELSLH
ncbi:MAG: HPr family phosphocarrier protein [Actinomycetaceae bacterium]|nr:HPr family phosphocarrier protein [Actinomycetaceae bacterium]